MFKHDILVKLFAKLKQIKILQALRQECGSILVFTAVGIPILLALIGFGFDVGNLYMHKARLQNVADAAALAGARAYVDNLDTTKGGTVTNGDIPSKPTHANEVAREYIAKNSINLPNDIYHDFNSLMIRESDESNTLYPNKAFYRIGLYENVPLYFLPIIKGIGKTQKVRAEAIAIAIPGETTTTTTPGSSTTTTTVERKPSLFDNLFTFSEYLTVENGVAVVGKDDGTKDGRIDKVFIGDIVYTHFNGSPTSSDNSNDFFNNATPGPGNDTHDNPNNYTFASSGFVSNGVINDPIIDTFYDTTAYVSAFLNKLNRPHVNANQSGRDKIYASDINNHNSSLYSQILVIDGKNVQRRADTGSLYIKDGEDYYAIDESTNNYIYVQDGSNQYKVKYVRPQNAGYTCKCVNIGGYNYLLNTSGQTSNCFVTTQFNNQQLAINLPNGLGTRPLKYENGEWKYGEAKDGNNYNDWYTVAPEQFSGGSAPADFLNTVFDPNDPKYLAHATNDEINSGVFFAPKYRSDGQQNTTFDIIIDEPLQGDEDTPIYIIVEEGVSQLHINGTASSSRPVIIAYLAHSNQIKFDLTGNVEFKGVIYAPYANLETSNFQGTFRGNIIAKNMTMSSGQPATWIQHNYLENDQDIQVVDAVIEQKIENAHTSYASLTQAEQDALQTEITNAFITEILSSQNAKQKAKLYGELFPERYAELYENYKTEVLENNNNFGHSELFVSWNELSDANKYDWGGLGTNLYTELYNKLNASEKADSVMIEKLKEKILDKVFYNNKLTYVDKQSGYRAWRTLYDKYKNEGYKDIIWPWNTNSQTNTNGGQTVTVTTPDNIRLINPRVEENPFTIYGIKWKML